MTDDGGSVVDDELVSVDASALHSSRNTPRFPWSAVIAVCFFWIASSALWQAPLPYTPWFAQRLYPSANLAEIGYYAGLIPAAAQVGQMASSIAWGRGADRFGRRPTILVCMLTSSIAFAAFGFADSLWMGVALSFAMGTLDGVMGVVKTVISEVCGDEHVAQGFGILGVFNAVVRFAAPTVGAFLAEPMQRASLRSLAVYTRSSTVWERYPFALPSVFFGLFGVATFSAGYFFIPETMQAKRASTNAKQQQPERQHWQQERGGASASRSEVEMAVARKVPTTCGSDTCEEVRTPELADKPDEALELLEAAASASTVRATTTTSRRCSRRCSRNATLAVALYAVLGLANSLIDTATPLWLLSSRASNGFALDARAIGIVLASPALTEIIFAVAFFPKLVERFGALNVLRGGAVAAALASFGTPLLAALNGAPVAVQWVALVFQQSAMLIGVCTCYSTVFVVINNSVFQEHRATVNGAAQTFVGLTRAIGPASAGALYAWSTARFPVHGFRLVFCLAGTVYFLLWGIAMQLPQTMNKQPQRP